jgi:GTP-binding protein EngB required for normal cell division
VSTDGDGPSVTSTEMVPGVGQSENHSAGYQAARAAGEALARSVREVAILIGERADEPVAMGNGIVLAPGLGMIEDAKILAARARDLKQGLFTIIVLGEFKNGKSTLLNAMLGSKTLPAKAAPATAIITVLVSGERPEVAVYSTGAEPRLVTQEEFLREFQLTPQDQETIQQRGSVDRFARVEYAEIETKHHLCALGVKLIDSPGLGEHVSRTRVATNFLKRSQAVIMVLNATRILTQDERSFIEAVLGTGRLPHVFFVVNRMDQIDEAAAGQIRQWLRSQLEHHFLDGNGLFDAVLWDRRVFFANARGALEARAVPDTDEAALEATGVPALEAELERFLTSDEKVAAALGSTTQFVQPVIGVAHDRVIQALAVLEEPLRVLEERRREAEGRLQALETKRRQTERTIKLFSDTVKQKVYADLLAFVDSLQDTWQEDSRRLMDLDRAVSLRGVMASYTNPSARQAMAVAINTEVQRYIQAKFGQWSARIPKVIKRDVDVLMAEVEAQLGDLRLELDRIAAAFADTPSRPLRGSEATKDASDVFRLALPLSEISDLTDEALGMKNMSDLLGGMVQRSLVVYLVRTFITGSFTVATLVVEAVKVGMGDSDVKSRVRGALGDRLTSALRDQVREMQGFIQHAVEERFEQFAGATIAITGRQIEEVRIQQERLIRERRDQGFSVEREKERLTTIDRLLSEIDRSLAEV